MNNRRQVSHGILDLVTMLGVAAAFATGCDTSSGAGASRTTPAGTAPPAASAAPSSSSSASQNAGGPASPFGSGDLGDYPVPAPVETVARATEIHHVETHAVGAVAKTKAVEIRIEGYQEVSSLNGRQARAGHAFVILDTSWKNIIPLQPGKPKPQGGGRTYGAGGLGFGVAREPAAAPASQPALEPTPYMVGEVPKHLWLVTDNRYADPIDLQATAQVPGHLPTNRLLIARFEEVLKGKVVFDVPADARYAALLFLDTTYGNVLIPLKGRQSDAPAPKTTSPPQQNELLELAISEAGWATNGPQPPDGFRYFVVGLRGTSRSNANIVQLEMNKWLFVQTEQGFVAQPEPNANWVSRPFAGLTAFLPGAPNEGQAVFLLPADARETMVLLRPPAGGPLDLPAPDRVKPTWPRPVATIADGATLGIDCLPAGPPPAGLRPPPAGKQYLVLDLVAENRQPRGVEMQPNQQLRLQDAAGVFYAPLPDSNRLAFHPTGRSVVPAGSARRFQLLYMVPTGQAMRLAYRGFEKSETVDLR